MTAHEHRAHATLAPSSAHRWMACPGSIRMASGIKDEGSVYAAEGTAAHELAEYCLKQHTNVVEFKGWTVGPGVLTCSETARPDGKTTFLVDDEMVDAVQTYLDVAFDIEAESDEFESEQRMDMTELVPGVFGTGDVIAYSAMIDLWRQTRRPDAVIEYGGRVTIVDLKYGKGVAVEVEENEQLLTYAMGVAQRYHNRGIAEVELVVVQPRAPHNDGPVRRWSTDVIGLYEHVAALQAGAVAADDPKAKLVAGGHCKFCKAAGFCGAIYDEVKRIMGTEQPEARPFQDWSIEQSELNLVTQWVKAREAFAHAEAVRGNPPPGAKLVDKRAFRKWIDEEEAGRRLAALGVDLAEFYDRPALKSPAVVEKLLPAAGKAILKTLAKAESSGTVIAPLSDKRPAVDASAANGFEAVE